MWNHVRVCLTLALLFSFMAVPPTINGNWGLEVGRADAGDVAGLVSDWVSFKRERDRLDRVLTLLTQIERQKQLFGVAAENWTPQQKFLAVQEYWLNNIVAYLQRIALNPAASCAEARFALATLIGMRRQQQLLGLEESEVVNNVYQATEAMASLRCRDEALDECVATGRFKQILDLMAGAERQAQMFGGEGGLEGWAKDALEQCAIYELHFISTTKLDNSPANVTEIVRDGRVPIRFQVPPEGLKAARGPLGDFLKGKTDGGNNPFFVSVKCTGMPHFQMICSPGANSTPIEVRINALDLRHREFYIDHVKDKWWMTETELSRERLVGEDQFSFDFSGGKFSIQALLKSRPVTVSRTMDFGDVFYMAHRKDEAGGFGSVTIKPENQKGGAHPVIFKFTYADQQNVSGARMSDSTDFELIHKPKPKPFKKAPEPIRKPLTGPGRAGVAR